MSVSVLLALGQVGHELGDVLFELGQVSDDVVLVELGVIVVLLVAGDGQLEAGSVEVVDHAPDEVTDADHLALDVTNLVFFRGDGGLAVINLLLKVALGLLLLFEAHGVDLSVSLELVSNALVLLVDHVDFRVEHVNVVEKRDVLLLSLDEGGDDLINGGDSCGLLDLLEGILDDLDVSGVHVHQVLLLLVVVDDLVETDLEKNGGVGEVSDSGLALLVTHVLGARLLSLVLILLLQALLQVKDAVLEVKLVHVVLGFESEDLVLGFL